MHENYMHEGVINDPEVYHMNDQRLILALSKLSYMGILIPISESAYLWAAGADPDYMDLAVKVLEDLLCN